MVRVLKVGGKGSSSVCRVKLCTGPNLEDEIKPRIRKNELYEGRNDGSSTKTLSERGGGQEDVASDKVHHIF